MANIWETWGSLMDSLTSQWLDLWYDHPDTSNKSISGDAYDNSLFGNGGNDTITGYAGSDTLVGGYGADKMIGGSGDDFYYADNKGDVVMENPYDGTDSVGSTLSYTLGANLENLVLSGTANISGTGNSFENIIVGNDGNNLLKSGNGNDLISGGLGADTMIGGGDSDTYYVDNTGDVIKETSTLLTEIETVSSTVTYTLSANLEYLVLRGTDNINGTGNASNNSLEGNNGNNILHGKAGNDNLFGYDGNDVLYGEGNNDNLLGGNGIDTLYGGSGDDRYFVDTTTDTIIDSSGTETVQSSVSYTLGTAIERLVLTGPSAVMGTGNTLNNYISGDDGGAANNILDGGTGDDTLNGGAGNDKLTGGTGSDTLMGGLDADKFIFSAVTQTGVTATTRDTISDFSAGEGDKIDLSAIDANAAMAGNNAFAKPTVGGTFSGSFANPGDLYFDRTVHILYGNNDADVAADFSILLTGVSTVSATNFVF
ncbi:MAG: calcium-binding protein [Methylovulum sp.]|nr:MAG: calcium-binding protein [Methylovulum sp.]